MRPGEFFLHELAEARHREIDSDPLGPKSPPGFRPQDYARIREPDGFVPVEVAARRLGLEEHEIEELARRRVLRVRFEEGGRLLVQPASVWDANGEELTA